MFFGKRIKPSELGKPSLHYYFAYKDLPKLIFGDYKQFKEIVNEGPSTVNNIFSNRWNTIKKCGTDWINSELVIPKNHNGLAFYTAREKCNDGTRIFCVYMPQVLMPPEAVLIAVVMYEDHARYFTCELSDEDAFVVGEVDAEFTHFNYGSVTTSEEFFSKIKGIAKVWW